MKKQILSVVLTVAAALAVSVDVMAKDGVWTGSGTEASPILIEDEKDLSLLSKNIENKVTNYEGKYFKLTDDIALTETVWTPIGNKKSEFAGIFDGDGHTVSKLNTASTWNGGLFGNNSGTIKNINVSGTVSGKYYQGLICGYNTGTVENVSSSGTVKGTSYLGGTVGYNLAVIKNAVSLGTVEGKLQCIGGITGLVKNGSVENAYNSANVVGSGRVGGIAGEIYDGVTVKNCYNVGSVSTGTYADPIENTNNAIGGIVGRSYNNMAIRSNIIGCTNFGTVSSESVPYAGGLIGEGMSVLLQDCINIGTVTVSSEEYKNSVGAIAAASECFAIRNCYYLEGCADIVINGENDEEDIRSAVWALNSGKTPVSFTVPVDDNVRSVTADWIFIYPSDMKTDIFDITSDTEKDSYGNNKAVFEGDDAMQRAAALCHIASFEIYSSGDVDGNGIINETDAALTLKYICGSFALSGSSLSSADVYGGDGKVDLRDVAAILKLAADSTK